jgi:hypothetical protein
MHKTITAFILFANIPWVDLMMLLVDILLYQLPLPRLQIDFELNLIITNGPSTFISSFRTSGTILTLFQSKFAGRISQKSG